jgi:hypothetical protein
MHPQCWLRSEHGHTSGGGDEVTQEVQPLRRQLAADKVDARRVAARPIKAGDKTKLDRVFGEREDNGDCRGCRLGRERGSVGACDNYRNLRSNCPSAQRYSMATFSLSI